MNTYTAANQSIENYDAYVFASVGRSFDANRADTLAAVAIVDCEIASRDRSVNQCTRDYYREQATNFRAIVA